jgi:hypothetical protein
MAKLCQKVKSKIQKRSNFNDFHSPKVKGKRGEKKKSQIQIFGCHYCIAKKIQG